MKSNVEDQMTKILHLDTKCLGSMVIYEGFDMVYEL